MTDWLLCKLHTYPKIGGGPPRVFVKGLSMLWVKSWSHWGILPWISLGSGFHPTRLTVPEHVWLGWLGNFNTAACRRSTWLQISVRGSCHSLGQWSSEKGVLEGLTFLSSCSYGPSCSRRGMTGMGLPVISHYLHARLPLPPVSPLFVIFHVFCKGPACKGPFSRLWSSRFDVTSNLLCGNYRFPKPPTGFACQFPVKWTDTQIP